MIKKTLFCSLISILVSASSASAQDQGPLPGHLVQVGCADPGPTEVIYKSPKAWTDMKDSNSRVRDSVECGTKMVVVTNSSLYEQTWFLSSVKILEGRHAGETWFIHSQDLRDLGEYNGVPAAKTSNKRKK